MTTLLTVLLVGCIAAVAYSYLGYPLIVWALARLVRGRPDPAGSMDGGHARPRVSLVVAAYNEEDWIEAKLENTAALHYPPELLQVVVAASGSTDRTAELVEAFGRRRTDHLRPTVVTGGTRAGKMAALNQAMATVDGEIVVFSDANNRYHPGTIEALVAPFRDPTVGCVTGAKTIDEGDGNLGEAEGLYWRYESWLKRNETAIGCCTAVAGEVLAIRRHLFAPAPAQVINDDFYMAMRIVAGGHRIVYAPKARSSERVSVDEADEFRRRSRIVAGRYQAIAMARQLLPWRRPLVVWQIVSHKFLRPLVPLFMIGALLANLGLVVAEGLQPLWPTLLLMGQVAFYGSAVLGGRFDARRPLGRLLYVPRFLLASNLAALAGLIGYLTGGQTALWTKAARRGNPQQQRANS